MDDVFQDSSDTEQTGRVLKPRLASISVPVSATLSILASPETQDNAMLSAAPSSMPLTILDVPYDNSAPDPVSPTPCPTLSALSTTTDPRHAPAGQPMQVDRNISPTAQPVQPGGEARNQNNDGDNPNPTPMRALLVNNKEYQNSLKVNRAGPRDPLDKYLKDPLPKVHVAHPAVAFDFVDPNKIDEWDTYPSNKLLAIPFGFEARQHVRHNNIRARILAAVVEITQAEQVGVAVPGPEDDLITFRNETPIAFLIHSLTKQQSQTLLRRETWISTEMSFRITTTTPTAPDYLFTLNGLSTVGVQAVVQMILAKWQASHVQSMLTKIVQNANERGAHSQINLQEFLNSATVQCLKVIKDKILAPKFNVYANGKFIEDYTLWTEVRDILKDISYDTAMLGNSTTELGPYDCNICHGADHPYGLCPFPLIKGWNGPSGSDEFTPEFGRDGRIRNQTRFNRRK